MTNTRYDDLRALFINGTLKRSPELTHTGGLVDLSRSIREKHGVTVEVNAPSTTTSPPGFGRT